MKKILVTGGLGYIGSHTVVELLKENFDVLVIDDLSNTSVKVLDGITSITNKKIDFIKGDLKDKQTVKDLFKNHPNLDAVIHFAASKAVGESVEKPLLYYQNNISSLIYLLEEMVNNSVSDFIFSSSCTVYGQADELPITETAPLKKATSPYGNTKKISEEIIEDVVNASNLNAISLRYFNPIGAHESAKIGELPIGTPQNLVPLITQVASGIRSELFVYGDDYPTPDGTAIRDYIHVIDLAKAHVMALKRLFDQKQNKRYEVFNLGTGKGSSVLEVIRTFEKVSKKKLNYKITERRKGDIVAAYAETSLANEVLRWNTELSLEDALASAWKWQQSIQNKH